MSRVSLVKCVFESGKGTASDTMTSRATLMNCVFEGGENIASDREELTLQARRIVRGHGPDCDGGGGGTLSI